MITIKTQAG